MHGRPRKAPSAEEQEAAALKAAKLRSLQSQFLQFHRTNTYTDEAIELSAKLLESNPDYYTAWNYRKLVVEHKLNQSETSIDSEGIKSILDVELRLVENALRINYKSYGAWHHRKWVLSKGHSSTDHELLLLRKFQKADSRNFHAWNYRRFITALKNIPDEEELQYTTDMIYDNFSNYSAWHNRSVLLSHLLKRGAQGFSPKENVLTEEYDFVRNALFTDPDDQSGWFYHLWLLDQTVKVGTLSISSWPSHGSTVCLSKGDDSALSPFCYYPSSNRKFPLILHFSEPVEGVNSSTVTVEYEHGANTDLTWAPLSTNKNGYAQSWSTFLNLPAEKLNPSKAYQVKVSLGHFEGINSSSGLSCSHSSHFTFTINIPSLISEHDEVQYEQRISWSEENFCMEETNFKDYNLYNTFHQVSLREDPGAIEWNLKTVADEIAHCRDLLSTMECKIGKLTLARLLMAQYSLMSCKSLNDRNMVQYEEVLELYNDLMKLDPPHFQHYKDQYSVVLLKQVTADNEFLQKRCHQYRDSSSSSINKRFCLRLNNLSLSRIGSVDRLLWVQMLDLSHNQLQSIEGLEAMQLLSCLNLSHNKLSSFTALEPLRLLKSLKVLDISYNEIGAHSIDTKRYLCSTPLTHSVGNDWNIDGYAKSGLEVTNYWEALTIFKDLKLTQLDIVGNAVADEKFKLFLFKIMPTLKWLDDENAH